MSLRDQLTKLLRKKFPKLTAAEIAREVNARTPDIIDESIVEPVVDASIIVEIDAELSQDGPVVETEEIVEVASETIDDEPEDVLVDVTEVSPVIGDAPDAPSDTPSGIDVTKISGIGKAMKERLAEVGITTVEQIAEMTPDRVAEVDELLDFKGRIDRDRWVQKAKELLA